MSEFFRHIMSAVYRSKKSQRSGSYLCPKVAEYAFEALFPDGKRLGVVFCYKGVVSQKNSACFFNAPFQTSRLVEASEPITFLGNVLGMSICWANHDLATRVFVEENKFLEELSLVGTAFFLEQTAENVAVVKLEKNPDETRKFEPNK